MDIVIIAHFVTEFAKEGTSRFVYIAEQLSRSHDVELITSEFDHLAKKQRTKQQYDLQTKVTLLEEPSYPKNVCLQRFISHAHFGNQVKKYLNSRKKPDVIYCAVPSLDCAYHAAKYAQKNHVKFIIDVQDLWPEAFKMVFNIPVVSDMIFYPMKRKADYVYSCADHIVGVSETYCKRAQAANKNNIACTPVFLGTKLDRFDWYAIQNKVARDDGKFIIGYCGTLGHSYDIRCVLDAMIKVRQRGHDNVAFWIMGDGPLKSNFEAYAAENGLDVTFYGRVPYETMCGLLCCCDVCVNPISKDAAQSIINKHGDYAASGRPVINTQQASEYRDLVSRYGCGINCECANAEDVALAIVRLMSNEAERVSMGEQSRAMAQELFDRNHSYLKIYQLFER